MSNVRKAKGFTLVEILIVVVILGILAAIVIPQFSSASQNARASSLVSTLQTIRSQLELAQIEHQGEYPAGDTLWADLTTETETDQAYTAGDDSGDEVGPYLQKNPRNPFAATGVDPESVAAVTGADNSTTAAWSYDADTGEIRANVDMTAAEGADLGLGAEDVDVNYVGS